MVTIHNRKHNEYKLRFYNKIPDYELDIELIRRVCIDRLNLFFDLDINGVDLCKETNKTLEYMKNASERTYNYLFSTDDSEQYQSDDISHHILNLVFCNERSMKKWYIMKEVQLFYYKSSQLSKEILHNNLHASGFELKPISIESKLLLCDILDSYNVKHDIDNVNVYKIPFHNVLSIVQKANVFLQSGSAYVLDKHLINLLVDHFADTLATRLNFLGKHINVVEDERIKDIINLLYNIYQRNYNEHVVEEDIDDASELDELCQKSFPPCMSAIHLHFRQTHHMNYFMRMQYGIFLKSLGLPLDQMIEFWKDEYTKIMSEDEFNKKYLYTIKYIYGLVGCKPKFFCYSCNTIVKDEKYKDYKINCGCTFAHRNFTNVKNLLMENNLSTNEIADIEDNIHDGCYTRACAKFFNYAHRIKEFDDMNNPCEYYERSKIYNQL